MKYGRDNNTFPRHRVPTVREEELSADQRRKLESLINYWTKYATVVLRGGFWIVFTAAFLAVLFSCLIYQWDSYYTDLVLVLYFIVIAYDIILYWRSAEAEEDLILMIHTHIEKQKQIYFEDKEKVPFAIPISALFCLLSVGLIKSFELEVWDYVFCVLFPITTLALIQLILYMRKKRIVDMITTFEDVLRPFNSS